MTIAENPLWEGEIPTRLRVGATGLVVRIATSSATHSFPLRPSQIAKIGRGANADIRVASADISRLHSSVRVVDGVVSITDLGSSNGTVVRGELLAPGEWRALAFREPVVVGDSVLVVFEGSADDVPKRVIGNDAFEASLEQHLATFERLEQPFGVCTIEVDGEGRGEVAWSDFVPALLAKNDVVGFLSESAMRILLANRDYAQLEIFRSVLDHALGTFRLGRKLSLRMCPRDGNQVRSLSPAAASRPAPENSARQTIRPTAPLVVSPAMRKVHELIDEIAPTTTSILILGETGVGKDVIARAIHQRSNRASAPIVSLNCAALPENLLESELFGYERGAFTGAVTAKRGLLEVADGGTVFLDELAEMPLATQAKLLRVLEDRTVMRVGGLKSKKVDFRLLAATNRVVQADIASGRFRADLYYRLAGIEIMIPSLRERREEIVPFVRYFAEHAATKLGKPTPAFESQALVTLGAYDWPGNVRELRNVVERLVLLASGTITVAQLPASVTTASTSSGESNPLAPADEVVGATARHPRFQMPPTPSETRLSLKDDLERLEHERIVEALEQHAGNQTRAAKALGITRKVLIARVERFGIRRPRKSD